MHQHQILYFMFIAMSMLDTSAQYKYIWRVGEGSQLGGPFPGFPRPIPPTEQGTGSHSVGHSIMRTLFCMVRTNTVNNADSATENGFMPEAQAK